MDPLAKEMYKEHILALYRHPDNYRTLELATHMHQATNPLCGDEVTMQFRVSENIIVDAAFVGKSCAICTASASLLTEECKGKTKDTVMSLKRKDVEDLLEIPLSVVRLKCALLPLEAAHRALGGTYA